eukprot:TRINITY_DN3750_c0_g2_i1.p1 TRINITY_DN3750_c0_g2~~TRINITY_DN3750_c0_g2_i1.p1  ORF type:complete len:647 (+),score=150.36 TRINITY_DN3750_c0_g2_i1:16-1956(+)
MMLRNPLLISRAVRANRTERRYAIGAEKNQGNRPKTSLFNAGTIEYTDKPKKDISFDPNVSIEDFGITGNDPNSQLIRQSIAKYLKFDQRVQNTITEIEVAPIMKTPQHNVENYLKEVASRIKNFWDYGMFTRIISLFHESVASGIEPNEEIYVFYMNALLSTFKLKELEDAWYRYNTTSNPISTAIIYPMMYCKMLRMDTEEVIKFYDLAESLNLEVDFTLHVCRLQYHLMFNQLEMAESYFEKMENTKGASSVIAVSSMFRYFTELEILESSKHRYAPKDEPVPIYEDKIEHYYSIYENKYRDVVLENMKKFKKEIEEYSKDERTFDRDFLEENVAIEGVIMEIMADIDACLLIESSLILRYAKLNQYEKMMHHLNNYNAIKPVPLSAEIYEAIMKCQLVNARDTEADKTWKVMRELNIIPHEDTFKSYIGSLGLRGNIEQVIELADEYHLLGFGFEPQISRTTMFSFYKLKNYDEVKRIYHLIIENGKVPDVICRNLMLLSLRMSESDDVIEGFLHDWIRSGHPLSGNAIEVAAEYFIKDGKIDDLLDLVAANIQGAADADPVAISLIATTLLEYEKLEEFEKFVTTFIGEDKPIKPHPKLAEVIKCAEQIRNGEEPNTEKMKLDLSKNLSTVASSVEFTKIN